MLYVVKIRMIILVSTSKYMFKIQIAGVRKNSKEGRGYATHCVKNQIKPGVRISLCDFVQ